MTGFAAVPKLSHPPDVIVDWTPLRVFQVTDEKGTPATELHFRRDGLSLVEPPDDDHPTYEGRLLAPLKRWIRANYGGQKRLGACTFYYRGQQWREWTQYLGPGVHRGT